MSTDERYEGWANRETWAVALHINNDQGWQEDVLNALREYVEETTADGEDVKIWHAGAVIRENVDDFLDGLLEIAEGQSARDYASVRDDLGSLWRVDWTELGAAFLADIAEADAYADRDAAGSQAEGDA